MSLAKQLPQPDMSFPLSICRSLHLGRDLKIDQAVAGQSFCPAQHPITGLPRLAPHQWLGQAHENLRVAPAVAPTVTTGELPQPLLHLERLSCEAWSVLLGDSPHDSACALDDGAGLLHLAETSHDVSLNGHDTQVAHGHLMTNEGFWYHGR
mmetsp:Transcript_16678/g.27515  ORF Transcript_16678/g.27515 Transcript_16678/m.27515 type:complete len:152 (+) Transcript_16678:26-481(+)